MYLLVAIVFNIVSNAAAEIGGMAGRNLLVNLLF